MIQQDQLQNFRHESQEGSDLLEDFLHEVSPNKKMLNEDDPTFVRDQLFSNKINLEEDHQQIIHPSLFDEKDQSDYLIALPNFEQLAPAHVEPKTQNSKKTANSPPSLNKKDTRNDKNAYLEESRAVKIERYRQKKQRRIWDRKIFYNCRKVVADTRERVNGRFAKKSPFILANESAKKVQQVSQELDILKEFSLEGKDYQNFCL